MIVIYTYINLNKSYEVNLFYLYLYYLALYFGISSTLLVYDSKYIFGNFNFG
jgi:hypothetical protein